MKRTLAGLAAVAVALTAASTVAQHTDKEKAAVAAAEKWLKLVDAGDYAGTWQAASSFFQKSVSEKQWSRAARAARLPLGELVSRKLKTATHSASLPGAPAGDYVVIQYESSFANQKSAVETVTPMLEPDGSWQVSGYFIK